MYWHRDKLMEIIEKLQQNYSEDAWNQHVFEVSKFLKTLKIIGKICLGIYLAFMAQLLSMPGIIKLYGMTFKEEVKVELFMQLELPVDPLKPGTYHIVSTISIWVILFGAFVVITTDLLFVELLTMVNMELKIVGQLMSEIDPSENEEKAIKELKELSQTHEELIEVTEELEEIFSPLMFIDCFGMLAVMCCAAFLTLSGISSYFLVKYFLTLATSLWNAFIICFSGDRLNEASLSVAEGAYNCNWYSGSNKFRKMIQIVMVRGQKVQKLTGMKFVDIDLEAFKWIIDAAYSYYSVLAASYKPS